MRHLALGALFLVSILSLTGCKNPLGTAGVTTDDFCPGNTAGLDNFCNPLNSDDGGSGGDDSEDGGDESDNTSVVSWDFSTSSDYSFDSNYVEITSGKASIKSVDTTHSGTDFSSGTHVGTYVNDDGELELSAPYPTSLRADSILSTKSGNLAGYWRMDGDWTDTSVNSNDGTAFNGTDFQVGKIGSNSGDFDGINDYVRVPSNTSLDIQGGFTISAWVNIDSYPSGNSRIVKRRSETGNTYDGYDMAVFSSGKVYCFVGDGSSFDDLTSDTSITVSTWSMISCVYDSIEGTYTVYVNGQADKSISTTRTPTGNSGNLYFGANGTTGIVLMDGQLDEVSIWNTPLSSEEISSLYNEQNDKFAHETELSEDWTPQWDSIVGYWKMDGNWQDSSGNQNHGTAIGNASFGINSKVGSQSGLFDGTGDKTQIPYSSELDITNSLTISAWVFHSSSDDVNSGIFEKTIGGTVSTQYSLFISNKFYFRLKPASSGFVDLISDSDTTRDSWTHVVATWNGVNGYLYIDGKLQSGVLNASSPLASGNGESLIGMLGSSIFHLNGNVDDLAVWNKSLSETEISIIYNRQKQKYAGHYESPIVDVGSSISWSLSSWLTSIPFYKELTGDIDGNGSPDSESSADYSALIGSTDSTSDDDFQNELIGLWHLNETSWNGTNGEVKDASGDGFDGTRVGDADTTSSSKLGPYAGEFDGTGDYITLNSSMSNSLTSGTISVSAWVLRDKSGSATESVLSDHFSGNVEFQIGTWANDEHCVQFFDGTWNSICSGESIPVGEWQHWAATYDGNYLRIYVDGTLKNTSADLSRSLPAWNNTSWLIGRLHTDTAYWSGNIDEVAIWNRVLSNSEVLQLYRRGANRLKLQIRSCDDSACSGEDWQGPDGSEGTYFSELFNKSGYDTLVDQNSDSLVDYTDYVLGGILNLESPEMTFADFSDAGLNIADNRYFQYRILMESDDENDLCSSAPCMPNLQSISISDSTKYYGATQTVTTSNGISYTELVSIDITADSCVSFQLSNDGTNFYFWDGADWSAVSSDSDNSSESDLESNIAGFSTKFGAGTLYLKSFITSDTASTCEIQNVDVTKR